MLFGLGEGLGFIFWNMKTMEYPFIGGRIKTDQLTVNITKNMNLDLSVQETSSVKKAWEQVAPSIDRETPVGLKLDAYHLEYFSSKIHFAGHYVALYGYDDKWAYLVDTAQQGGQVKTSRRSLELARNEKGPMSSKNLSYTIEQNRPLRDLEETIPEAVRNNAQDFLHPPIANIGYRGIAKTAGEVRKWFSRSADKKRDFTTTAMLMEKAGTGGALFRNLYRDFLLEGAQLLDSDLLREAHACYREIAEDWTAIASHFDSAGRTGKDSYINEASALLTALSDKEKQAMELLSSI
jgi:hypothetical protein